MGGTNRTTALGRYGEDVACRHLLTTGWEILERNWRCGAGEIDIVARDGEALVVVEVKTRSSDTFGSPQEAVTPAKVARLRTLAAMWLSGPGVYRRPPTEVRVDVVAVRRPTRGPAVVEHLRGVG